MTATVTPITAGLALPPRFQEPQYRSVETETVDIDDSTGEVYLRAVQYDYWTQLGPQLFESFAPRSLERAANAPSRVKMAWDHGGKLIGHAKEIEDRADGLYARMAFSKTPTAQEARELVLDGTLDQCSMVFRPMKEHVEVRRSAEGLRVRHARAHLLSVDLVTHGAYGEAAVVVSAREASLLQEREELLARLRSMNA